jgi:hypothetical protein
MKIGMITKIVEARGIARTKLAQRILKQINVEDSFTHRLCVLAGYDAATKMFE